MNRLPTTLYSAAAAARLDQIAITDFGIPGYTLMRRAGRAVFDALRHYYPASERILVLCGAGNNAGDGYVVARIAKSQGLTVRVVSMIDPAKLQGDAAQAWQHWQECGETEPYQDDTRLEADVVVDALLGTGLKREVQGAWRRLIETLNRSAIPVIAVDIPSGLNADTGAVSGISVSANQTVSFIALKKGMFTASGKSCAGEIIFDDLAIPADAYASVKAEAMLLSHASQWQLPQRQHSSHKGENGHVLIVGGNYGMPGAVALAARAALRAGAGLVSVVTRAEHINAVVAVCPEAMVHGSVNGEINPDLLESSDYIAIGCGLGQDAWAQRLLYTALNSTRPLVVDADALNLLAQNPDAVLTEQCVITPHPGEAARLLRIATHEVQQDRFTAAALLEQKYNAMVVLKGSGSLIQLGSDCYVCAPGNPAMATAGMGDVLTGMIVSLAAQQTASGGDLNRAVTTAVCLHARAGDLAARGDDRGLMASDVIEHIRAAARQQPA